MLKEENQITFADLGISSGKTSPEHSRQKKEKTSRQSSKKSSGSSNRKPPLCLCLKKDGQQPDASTMTWEDGALLGAYTMHSFGESPSVDVGSRLSQILEVSPHPKYYLSAKACDGILRRAFERGKELPSKLKRALQIQAGVVAPDGQPTTLESYHINQRDEGIDLHGKSGALMATTNMQMQTFVTQAETTDTIAFAANQRDEVRDLHDVAGALGSQPGMKQQTFIAAGFSAGQGSKAGGIGYQEEIAPTLKGAESGTNMVPSVLCLNDQGGKVMECSENVTGTLRAQEHGHQPLVYENHGSDSRYTGPHEVCPTMSARYGTGGNNVPLVEQELVFCITGNAIDRQPHNGGNGIGYQEDIAYTLTATDHHAVFSRQRVDVFKDDDVVSTQSARQHKDATDLIYQAEVFGQSQFGNYSPGCSTLRAQGGDNGGGSENLVAQENVPGAYLIRRLTQLECERLQGYPDGWTDIGEWVDSKGKRHDSSDSARYKALGNSIALPFWHWLFKRISAQYVGNPTLGSLFDGISGFCLSWARCNGAKNCRWSSEIEEFPMAVTRKHFGDEKTGEVGDIEKYL